MIFVVYLGHGMFYPVAPVLFFSKSVSGLRRTCLKRPNWGTWEKKQQWLVHLYIVLWLCRCTRPTQTVNWVPTHTRRVSCSSCACLVRLLTPVHCAGRVSYPSQPQPAVCMFRLSNAVVVILESVTLSTNKFSCELPRRLLMTVGVPVLYEPLWGACPATKTQGHATRRWNDTALLPTK